MFIIMIDCGFDSVGIVIYGDDSGKLKIIVQFDMLDDIFVGLDSVLLVVVDGFVLMWVIDIYVVLILFDGVEVQVCVFLIEKGICIMGVGQLMEIYKEVGLFKDVVVCFVLCDMVGSYGIGYMWMVIESVVMIMGVYLFLIGVDQCFVYNGLLLNYVGMWCELVVKGFIIQMQNDIEVVVIYILFCLVVGVNLGQVLEGMLDDLDGFFIFVVGIKNGFGVVCDFIVCKFVVMVEIEDYVVFGSEYCVLVNLLGIENVCVWEFEFVIVYFWEC